LVSYSILNYDARSTTHQILQFPFRDSSADDDHSPPAGLRNRKPNHSLTKRVSADIELGLLTGDKAENGNRSRSSSELSYGYQYDTNAAGPSVGDTHKPVRTATTAWFGVTLTAHTHKNLAASHIPTVSLSATQMKFADHDGIRPVTVASQCSLTSIFRISTLHDHPL